MKNANRLRPRQTNTADEVKKPNANRTPAGPTLNEAFEATTAKRKSLTVRLTEDDLRRFAIARATTGQTAQDILEQAVRQYIANVLNAE